MTDLLNPIFTDAKAAREHLEKLRWPYGPYCPHCGEVERCSPVKGKSHRPGLYYCLSCKGQFTVTVGTVFERSKIPLNKWLLAFHLMASSKKGMSAHQLHRTLGVTYKTAWFMAHRVREAMRPDFKIGMGGDGGAVEIDETFIGQDGNKPRKKKKGGGYAHMNAVLSLVDRETGRAASFPIKNVRAKTIAPIVRQNVYREAKIMTDEASHYTRLGEEYAEHGTVRHKIGEYVKRRDPSIHTNTLEGFFSIFKRGMKGVYQHCGTQHLHRYLAEFDFRYSNRVALGIEDAARRDKALKGITGKRLTYQRTHEARHA